MAPCSIRKFVLLTAVIYCIFTLYSTFSLWKSQSVPAPPTTESLPKLVNVEIWGKAAVGEYLWSHILEGKTELKKDEAMKIGNLITEGFNFTYRNGFTITPATVPQETKFAVLVINGMSEKKKEAALAWLEAIHSGSFKFLEKIILVILGDEQCKNEWLYPYMESQGGPINAAFIIYDSTMVDGQEFFQWPLGVATYRNFPNFIMDDVDILMERLYVANFLGTIYPNSSRVDAAQTLELSDAPSFLKTRETWSPTESPETLNEYIQVLMDSDLTLSPVGKNSECYRIFEALSVGSVPIVEDLVTPGNCDSSADSPLRLLKKHEAPIIYVKSWKKDLPLILEQEKRMSLQEKIARRATVVNWYADFRKKMRDEFLRVLRDIIPGVTPPTPEVIKQVPF